MTEILRVDPKHPEAEAVGHAALCICDGGLVAFPTETVYGLGANAFDAKAVDRIFVAKQRPATDPIIVHIASFEQMADVVSEPSDLAKTVAREFWPGPLTIIQRRGKRIPANVSAGLATVAVRFPRHPVALALIRAAGVPIAAPSANLFARPSATTAQHVLEDLGGRFEIVLDGGPTEIGLESSVVDLISDPPLLLRPGGIPFDALKAVIPNLKVVERYHNVQSAEAQTAPGQLLRHYSPRGEMYLVMGKGEAGIGCLRRAAAGFQQLGRRVGILVADEDASRLEDLDATIVRLGSRSDLDQIGANLFIRLRELDNLGVNPILIGEFELNGIGLAIRDRIVRASEGRIIE